MAHIRDPMNPFWQVLEKRFRAAARLLHARSTNKAIYEPEDSSQQALIAAKSLYDRRKKTLGSQFSITAELLEECVDYGCTSMRNAFRKELSRSARFSIHPGHLGLRSFGGDVVFDIQDVRQQADLRAIANDWIKRMRPLSRSSSFARMLNAFAELIEEGFPEISIKDIAERAGVGSKDIYKFKRIAKGARFGLAIKGSEL